MENNMGYFIEKTNKKSNRIVIVLPGISGGLMKNKIYNFLADEIKKQGFDIIRPEIWSSVGDIETKSMSEIISKINEIVNSLHKDYEYIYLVGKSFGGALGLLSDQRHIEKMVLWAPAINFSNTSTIAKMRDVKLSNIKDFNEINIDGKDISAIKNKIMILHGDCDSVVELENSKRIAESNSNFIIKIVNGADHSYEKDIEMREVVNDTIKFIMYKKNNQ